MIRTLAAMTVLALNIPAMAGDPGITPVNPGTHCETQTTGGDVLDVECALDAAETDRRFRFKVTFSGGHDDTKASIRPALNGGPLVCEEGSKTSLFGEEGDVSLECRFSIPAGTVKKHVFKVRVLWSHAQYTNFELNPD